MEKDGKQNFCTGIVLVNIALKQVWFQLKQQQKIRSPYLGK